MLWYGFIFLSCSVHKVHISLSHPRAFCCRNTNHHWDLKLKFVGVFPQGTIKIAPQNWFQTRVITCTPRSKNPFEEQKSNAVESFLSDDSCTRLKFCLPFSPYSHSSLAYFFSISSCSISSCFWESWLVICISWFIIFHCSSDIFPFNTVIVWIKGEGKKA